MTAEASGRGPESASAYPVGSDLSSDAAQTAEMLRLERLMHTLDWRDPERARVVKRYDAICDKLGVPSGDK